MFLIIYSSTPKVILDSEDRIITVLAGRPKDVDWERVVLDALLAMDEVRQFAADNFETSNISHSQGDSIAIAAGVSYGGGQRVSQCSFDLPSLFSDLDY